MLILVSVATYSGINTYKNAQIAKFIAQMQLIQTKVDELVEEKNIENIGEEITTDEAIKNLVANNEHTINRLRVNGTLPMFTPWIDYYNVKKTNKLYLDIDKRAKIW